MKKLKIHLQFLKVGILKYAINIHFPADLSSKPNQTHMRMLINVFRIIRKSQVGEFEQGWTRELNETMISGGGRHSRVGNSVGRNSSNNSSDYFIKYYFVGFVQYFTQVCYALGDLSG